ncbi:MAG: hypothetical protein IPM23_18120 [Candidatus Melainabacteria bacterium]|nr:hypothetical protein [Candidatus Melainabacteria bacterium]
MRLHLPIDIAQGELELIDTGETVTLTGISLSKRRLGEIEHHGSSP